MTDDWKLPWDGLCLCGAIRLRIGAPPLLTIACHCSRCRKRSASAYSLTMSVPGAGFAVTSGEPGLGGGEGPDRLFFARAARTGCSRVFMGATSSMSARPCSTTIVGLRLISRFSPRRGFRRPQPPRSTARLPAEPRKVAAQIEAFAREGARPG